MGMTRIGYVLKYCRGRTLDIGCTGENGDGMMHRELMKALPQQVDGLDLRPLNVTGYIQGDCQDIPLADQQYDTVVMGQVIEHVDHPLDALKEAYRMLKDYGRVIVSVPNAYAIERMAAVVIKGRELEQCPEHRWLFSVMSLTRLMLRAGFVVMDARAIKGIGATGNAVVARGIRLRVSIHDARVLYIADSKIPRTIPG